MKSPQTIPATPSPQPGIGAFPILGGVIVLETAAHLLLRFGASGQEWKIWTGLGVGTLLLAVHFYLWMLALARVPLGLASTVTAVTFATIPLGAVLFLGEELSLKHWTGIGLILIGSMLAAGRAPK